jgi:hypothetical protein
LLFGGAGDLVACQPRKALCFWWMVSGPPAKGRLLGLIFVSNLLLFAALLLGGAGAFACQPREAHCSVGQVA